MTTDDKTSSTGNVTQSGPPGNGSREGPGLPDAGIEAFEILGRFLEEDGWFPQRLPTDDGFVYRMSYRGQSGTMPCYAQIRPRLSQFLFYVMAPVKADPARRAEICEFIARANYGLRIGNIELDFDDGEIRYKSSLDYEGAGLSPALIKGAIYPAVQTMDDYLPGILSVLFGGATAKAAIEAIER